MSSKQNIDTALRRAIRRRPQLVLDDPDLMEALVAAGNPATGGNVVDLRGVAMNRLESRLDRLEDTHRSVIAAAYENLAGTQQIHRAVLRLLDPSEFDEFLKNLASEVADTLRVDAVKLVLETTEQDAPRSFDALDDVLAITSPGFVDAYLAQGRSNEPRAVILREVRHGAGLIYGTAADWIRSEACLRLDLGAGRMPGLLVLGSEDPQMFTPHHGTDLLTFFTGVFERAMRRWLA